VLKSDGLHTLRVPYGKRGPIEIRLSFFAEATPFLRAFASKCALLPPSVQ
jgi:hypothetical protein